MTDGDAEFRDKLLDSFQADVTGQIQELEQLADSGGPPLVPYNLSSA